MRTLKFTPPTMKHLLLLVAMLFCSVSSVLADDSNLITQQITINVSEAGTLQNKIGSNRKDQITNLKITGSLNLDDFAYLTYFGNLQFLDLKGVQLVDGESPYTFDIYGTQQSIKISKGGTKISGPFFLFFSNSLQPMSVILPNNITCLGDYCFFGCSLESITIPSGVTEIGDNAFHIQQLYNSDPIVFKQTSVASIYVEMPTPSKIGETHVFYQDTKPSGAKYWRELDRTRGPFEGFMDPFELYVPKGSLYIYKNSAWGEDKDVNIKEYDLVPSDELITQQKALNVSEAGTLRNLIDENEKYKITNLKVSGYLNIDDIEVIREMAGGYYGKCGPQYPGHLYHLDLKDAQFVASDKQLPFYDKFNNNVQYASIGNTPNRLFSDLYSLQSIILPDNLDTVGYGMLKNCEGLTSLEIPSGVTSIGDDAFWYCSGLTSLEIPSGVTSIGGCAFWGCSGLTSLEIPSGVTSIENRTFYNCSGLTSLEIPSGVTSIGWLAFGGCSGLTSLEIPSSVTSIREGAFMDCHGLTSLEIPSGVTSIEDETFRDCSGLTSLQLPSSVTSVGSQAFSGCSGLSSLEIPSKVTSIGDKAFYGCSGLISLQLPSGLTSVGSQAFSGCSGLSSMEIPSGITSIKDETFSGCSGLTSLSIPSGVASIGTKAFNGCSGLTSVYAYMPTPITLDAEAFYSADKDKCTLYVPQGSYLDYWFATGWDYFNNIVEFDATGIDSVTTKSDAKEVSRYSVDGQKLDAPVKGLNIVKYSDGSIKKVVVK